jgi:hypothetical protein
VPSNPVQPDTPSHLLRLLQPLLIEGIPASPQTEFPPFSSSKAAGMFEKRAILTLQA